MKPPEDVIRWLQNGERGISADTIVATLYDFPFVRDPSHPWDPDDFRRCQALLDACPSIAVRFQEMVAVNPIWAGLVAVWPELWAMIQAESTAYRAWERTRRTPAPVLRAYPWMREIIAAGQAQMPKSTGHGVIHIHRNY